MDGDIIEVFVETNELYPCYDLSLIDRDYGMGSVINITEKEYTKLNIALREFEKAQRKIREILKNG